MKSLLLLIFLIIGTTGYSRSDDGGEVKVIEGTHVNPKAIQDHVTKVIFYLESDGRHIAAIGPAGKLLWNCDPFVDAKLTPYRFPKPIICYFDILESGRLKFPAAWGNEDEFIEIHFNSSQFGVLRKDTGKFRFMGQN